MKTIKKVLALVISLALLLTMFSMVSLVPASAETEILMIYDGETLPTHQTTGTFSLSTDVKSQGNSSLKIVQNVADGQYSFQHDMAETVALADYDYLCIDYQIQHPWQVSAANEIYISLSGDAGRVNYGLNPNYFGNGYTGEGNRDGGVIHSIKIPLADFAEKTTQISSFQIWQPNVNGTNWGILNPVANEYAIYFDNIRLERTVRRHTITASAYEGGTISPNGATSVVEGSDQTFTITPAEGMKIDDVEVDGESVGAVSEYTFTNVTSAHTITAFFMEQEMDSLMIYDGETLPTHQTTGTFSLSTDVKSQGNSSLKIVQNAADGQYSFQHDMAEAVELADYDYLCIDYQIEHPWQVSAANEIYISLSGDAGRVNYGLNTNYFGNGYTGVGNRDAGVIHSIKIPLTDFAEKTTQVSSVQIWQPNVTAGNWAIISHLNSIHFDNIRLERSADRKTITATAGAGGTITPAGVIGVANGGTKTFTITPEAGMKISDVLVDGVSVGAVDTYTFTNVTENRTIEAVFATIPVESLMLYDGEDLPTYETTGTFSLSTDDKTQGDSSLRINPDSVGQFSFKNLINAPASIDYYDYLKIDVKVTHPWLLSATNDLFISLSGEEKRINIGQNENYFGDASTGVGNLPNEFTTITIPLSLFTETTEITEFEIWLPSVWSANFGILSGLEDKSIYFDNIRLTKNVGEPVCEHTTDSHNFIGKIEATVSANGNSGEEYCEVCGNKLADSTFVRAYGDTNGDDSFDILDLICLKNYTLGSSIIAEGTGDLNHDTIIGAQDLVELRKALFAY